MCHSCCNDPAFRDAALTRISHNIKLIQPRVLNAFVVVVLFLLRVGFQMFSLNKFCDVYSVLSNGWGSETRPLPIRIWKSLGCSFLHE